MVRLQNKVSRRQALTTAGKAAMGAVAIVIIGGVAYTVTQRPAGTTAAQGTVTVTEQQIITKTTAGQAVTTTAQGLTVTAAGETVRETATETLHRTQTVTEVKEAAVGEDKILRVAISPGGSGFTQHPFDPPYVNGTMDWSMNSAFYDRLIELDFPIVSRTKPGIAKRWDTSEDKKVWTFDMRTDVEFWSGNPVDAHAVKFSYDRVINHPEGNASWMLGQVLTKDSVKVIDNYTVEITMSAPRVDAEFLFSSAPSSIVDPSAYHDEYMPDFPAGSGPFKLKTWEKDARYEVEANENYYAGPARVEEIRFMYVPDSSVQKLLLENGEVDVALDLSRSQKAAADARPDIKTVSTPDFWAFHIGYHMNEAPFDDKRMRKAVRLAIDWEGIAEFYGDDIITLGGIGLKGLVGYDPSLVNKRDLEQAKSLVSEAGYGNGVDTKITNLDTTRGGVNLGDLNLIIADNLADAGINVTSNSVEWSIFAEEYKHTTGGGMWMSLWGTLWADMINMYQLAYDHNTGWGADQSQDQDVTRQDLIDKIGVTYGASERDALMKEFQGLDSVLDGPLLYGWQLLETIPMRSNVNGLAPVPIIHTVWHPVWKEKV